MVDLEQDLVDLVEVGTGASPHAGGQGNDAVPVVDGFRGVGDQIQDNLLDLRHVTVEGRQVLGEVVGEHGLIRDRNLEQVRHLLEEFSGVDWLDDELAFARVCEHPYGLLAHKAERSRCAAAVGHHRLLSFLQHLWKTLG